MEEANTSTSSRRYRRRTVRALDHSIDGHRGQSTKPSHGRRTSSVNKKKNVLLRAQQLPVFAIPPQFHKEWIVSNSLVILIEFLLFSRGLFPLTVTEIKETAEVQPRCPRKLLLANTQVQTLSHQILSLCTDDTQSVGTSIYHMDKTLQSASFLMISLGPSRTRCQEFYLLDLREWPTTSKEENESNASSSASRPFARLPPRDVLARRILPRWMSAEIPSLPSQSHKFQLYVSLWMNPQQQETYYNGTVGAPPSTGGYTNPFLVSRPENAQQRMPSDPLPPEWVPCSSPFPRMGQRCSSRRQPSLIIQPIAPATYASENTDGSMVPWTELPFFQLDPSTTTGPPTWSTVGQWLTLRSSAKGFRLDH